MYVYVKQLDEFDKMVHRPFKKIPDSSEHIT